MKSNVPKMPKNMPSQCNRWWRRIMKVIDRSILIPSDAICLEMVCMSLAVHERMAKDIKQKGRNKVIYLDDKKMLSDSEKILSISFDQLLLSGTYALIT